MERGFIQGSEVCTHAFSEYLAASLLHTGDRNSYCAVAERTEQTSKACAGQYRSLQEAQHAVVVPRRYGPLKARD
jgi:hypothetical protein